MADILDMRAALPDARDQGLRPTCLAFAMSDGHMAFAHPETLLSVDFLHYHAALRAGVPQTAGVGLRVMRDALSINGQPAEAECPYSDTRTEDWRPPTNVTSVWTSGSRVCDGSPSVVLADALKAGKAHVLVLRISRSFHAPDATSHVVKEDGGTDRRLHAVLVVGLKRDGSRLAFLVRNSWGPDWGLAGYAWLPSEYVEARAVNVVELQRGTKQ